MECETEAINVLEGAFTDSELETYVFYIQDYFADETDQLAEDSPKMEDFLNDLIPELTESYTPPDRGTWLKKLRRIIEHAKTLAN
ncbi:hypothetical protein [Lacticaseibacillus sharpeae]|uniref:hypothetical protein n=1 Tax=Lacticaseibacillus sharpeae TaxID=1626 RepID=UPI0006D2C3AB|nr:hypothetical protein [Lacticaseibacillus sharpeae]